MTSDAVLHALVSVDFAKVLIELELFIRATDVLSTAEKAQPQEKTEA